MKALRIILAVVGGLLLLVIVAAIIFVKTFDPNSLKDNLTAYVQERTGRTLSIGQDIELSLFPWFAVETGGVTLSDDPAFSAQDFVSIDSLSARIRVWPLLRRRVEIGRVIFDGVNLNLSVDADGRGNWSTLLPSDSAAGTAAATPTDARRQINQLAVEGIELRNARILWHDAAGEVRYLVRDLRLSTGPIRDSDPVDLKLSFGVLDVASQAAAEIELQTVATVTPSRTLTDTESRIRVLDARNAERATATLKLGAIALDGRALSIGPSELETRLIEPPVGPDRLELNASIAAVELDLDDERLVVNGFNARTGEIATAFNVAGEAMLSDPRLSGTASLNRATLGALAQTFGLTLPPELSGDAQDPVSGNATFAVTLAPLSVNLSQFALTGLGAAARGNATRDADGNLAAHIELPAFAPTPALRRLIAARLPAEVDTSVITSANATADVQLPADSDRLELSSFAVGLDGTSLTGNLSVIGISTPSRVTGRVTADGLDNRQLTALFGTWLPADMLQAELGQFHLATGFDYATDSGLARFDPVALTAYGLSGEGRLEIQTATSDLRLNGQASLAPFSPRALLARFDLPVPQSSDPNVLGRAQLAAAFETTGNSGRFRDIAITLDDSRITGEFSVENFADPSYRFVLRADRIDADRYLPPQAAAAPEAGAAAAGGGTERKLGDMRLANDALSATVVTGTASVGDLTIGGMHFEQLATDLAVGGGRLALSSVRTRLYGGEFSGGLTVDAAAEIPTVQLTGKSSNLAIQPLLDAMFGQANVSGTAAFDLDLSGQGNTVSEALQTTAGRMNFDLRDGQIDGFNLDWVFCSAFNGADRAAPPPRAPDLTRFSAISAAATVSEGIANTPMLSARTEHFEGTGSGRMRLVDSRVDYNLRVALVSPVAIANCDRLNSQVGKSIPFTYNGVLGEAVPKPDVSQYLEDRARDAVRDRVGEALRGLLN